MRQRPTEPRLALGEPEGRIRGLDGPWKITEAMLAQLGDLDPGKRPDRPASGREADPGRLGIPEPAEPTQQPHDARVAVLPFGDRADILVAIADYLENRSR